MPLPPPLLLSLPLLQLLAAAATVAQMKVWTE
jgi:hypothetical protein